MTNKSKCPLCIKKYESRNKLKKHFKKIHGLNLDVYEKEQRVLKKKNQAILKLKIEVDRIFEKHDKRIKSWSELENLYSEVDLMYICEPIVYYPEETFNIKYYINALNNDNLELRGRSF